MGDEKTQPGKTPDKPPTPVRQQAPKDQHAGPAKAAGQKQPAGPQPAKTAGGGQQAPKQATAAGHTAALQKSTGNQQVNRLMRAAREPDKDPHTPGVKVSHPQDAAEKEAEAVAKHVTGGQSAHAHGHSGQVPGDPAKVVGDPPRVHRDPDAVHRAVANHAQPTKPQPATAHPTAPAPQHPAPRGPSATSALDHPGPGGPIPQPTRGTLEAKLKTDLSHVVVHHDAEADRAVRALHARAVTRGNHIFLASDASPNDLPLMAHEVAHVLQHNDDTVHRLPSGTAAPPAGRTKITGRIDPPSGGSGKSVLRIDSLPVPDFKLALTKAGVPLTTRTGEARGTRQIGKWTSRVRKGVTDRVNETIRPLTALTLNGADVYYFRAKAANGLYVFGDAKTLVEETIRPRWDRTGAAFTFQVDHKLEYQLGGEDEKPVGNLWLLEAAANGSSGSSIKAQINTAVGDVLEAERSKGKTVAANASDAREQYIVMVADVTGGVPVSGSPTANWEADEISEKGLQLKALEPMKASEVDAAGLKGSPKELVIYVTGTSKGIKRVPWGPGTPHEITPPKEDLFFTTPFRLNKIDWAPGRTGKIYGLGFRDNRFIHEVPLVFDLLPMVGIEYGGRISEAAISNKIGKALSAAVFSPLTFDQVDLVDGVGIVARGKLLPSIPLISKLDVDVVLYGGELRLERTFAPGEIPAPPPFKITQSDLTVFADTSGIGARGNVAFQLGQFAHGTVIGSVTAGSGFALDGRLDFDKTLFEPAGLKFFYHKTGSGHDWGIEGKLGIPPKKVPGIGKGTITASYANGKFAADGKADLSVPGLQSGSLAITYSEKDGVAIGGKFALAPNPAVESGSVDATVTKRPPGERWALSAHGTVKPKIPGVDTTLSASYEDGVFTVEGSVAYARGMLAGSLTVGLTNRPPGPDGQPAAGAPAPGAPKGGPAQAGGPLRPYGGGTLTATIAPWLQGSVGVRIQKDGSVQLTGEIKLPDAINLFDPVQVDKNLLAIGVDIPIVGVSVAGQRIGIFATIQGGLDLSAGIGPGQLKQLGLKVQYNPEHEEQTQITGTAQLAVPAHAGLRLYVRGGLGAGIPVVSAEAGLEIGGRLGVEGAVQSGVTVNWTPKRGLTIDAQAKLSAQPSFTFDVNGYVKVSADLVLTTVNLYEKHWQLASFQYGSGLRVGVTVPIHYEQGKPFGFSLSDAQFELPKIDPMSILTDLVHKVA